MISTGVFLHCVKFVRGFGCDLQDSDLSTGVTDVGITVLYIISVSDD